MLDMFGLQSQLSLSGLPLPSHRSQFISSQSSSQKSQSSRVLLKETADSFAEDWLNQQDRIHLKILHSEELLCVHKCEKRILLCCLINKRNFVHYSSEVSTERSKLNSKCKRPSTHFSTWANKNVIRYIHESLKK